jgi:hypothetical protein
VGTRRRFPCALLRITCTQDSVFLTSKRRKTCTLSSVLTRLQSALHNFLKQLRLVDRFVAFLPHSCLPRVRFRSGVLVPVPAYTWGSLRYYRYYYAFGGSLTYCVLCDAGNPGPATNSKSMGTGSPMPAFKGRSPVYVSSAACCSSRVDMANVSAHLELPLGTVGIMINNVVAFFTTAFIATV